MRVLVDASHQRSGGGLQVSHGVLSALSTGAFDDHDWHILAPEGSSLHGAAEQLGVTSTSFPVSSIDRILRGRSIVQGVGRTFSPDMAYTVFGPPLPRHAGIATAAGMAYSNLLYPEVDFWAHLPRRTRLARQSRDALRKRSVLRSTGLMFETEALQRRALNQWGLDRSMTAVVPPTVSEHVSLPPPDPALTVALDALPVGRTYVLMASGYHPNKNLDQVPAIAAASGQIDFLLTLDPSSPGARHLCNEANRLRVGDRLHFVGTIPQVSVGHLYRRAHTLLLISELESFSNNVIEAFATRCPLVLSDRDWARSAAPGAAVFVQPRDPRSVAAGIAEAVEGPGRCERVTRGTELLAERHGSQVERLNHVLEFLHHLKDHL